MRHGRWVGWVACVSFALLGVSCTPDDLSLTVRFSPVSLGQDVDQVELFLAPDCSQNLGDAPPSGAPTLRIERGSPVPGFGSVAAGSYGLTGRGFGGCGIVAAGCQGVEVGAGSSLEVTLSAFTADGCPAGLACVGGSCVTPDGGQDAGVDAPDDVFQDGECPVCAPPNAGACRPDDSNCAPGQVCDAVVGCRDSKGCESDGLACTNAGARGMCIDGACCSTCVAGAACNVEPSTTSCGADGEACFECPCATDSCGTGCNPLQEVGIYALGHAHTCMMVDADLWCWGLNGDDQALGGVAVVQASPRLAAPAVAYSQLHLGEESSCGLRDGEIWCWGGNSRGQLGQPVGGSSSAPIQLGTDDDWAFLPTGLGGLTMCALKTDGSLWCWGGNFYGQLVDGGESPNPTPRRVGSDTWRKVSTGRWHVCAERMDGRVFCWGQNISGQAGVGTVGGSVLTPTEAVGPTNLRSLDAGYVTTCAVDGAGVAWCWGSNSNGRTGLGLTSGPAMVPTRLSGGPWASVAAGRSSTYAIHEDGSLWSWGSDEHGQGARAGTLDSAVPLRTTAPGTFASVRTGEGHACAMRTEGGRIECFGKTRLEAGECLGYPCDFDDVAAFCFGEE